MTDTTEQHGAAAEPVVSLLIPIYNVERYLRECLDSAAAQTLRDIEIICINDGSRDACPEIIREYMARDVRFRMIDKANSGYGDSMNRGLEAARGTYVAILESDDVMEPGALEKLVTAAKSCNADFAKANFELFWTTPEPRREFHEMFRAEQCGRTVHPAETPFIFHTKPSIWSAVYKRSFLNDAQIRFLPTPGAAFQDTSFTFKVFALAERAVYVHESVLNYRQDNEGSSINSSDKADAILGEYAEIERWLHEDFAATHGRSEALRLLRISHAAKYDSCMWGYVRLAPELHVGYLERVAAAYRAAIAAGEFDPADLKPWKRANLEAIMADPAVWECENADYAQAGALGRAKHYLKLGGPGLLLAYAKARLTHEE